METVAAWWFQLALYVALPLGGFVWGSWHRKRYEAKHERVEERVNKFIDDLPADVVAAEAKLNGRLDSIAQKAEAEITALRDAFNKRRG